MARYFRSSSRRGVAWGICDRTRLKTALADLVPDPNAPGLMVRRSEVDELDPYRLPAPAPDTVALPFTRPEERLTASDDYADEDYSLDYS